MDDFTKLDDTEHMLKWFVDEPYKAIRATVAEGLQDQVAGSQLVSFKVVSAPHWLTGARKVEDGKALVVRSGVAFEFALDVEAQTQLYHLTGVFTWVVVRLDTTQPQQKIWIDLDGTLEKFGEDGELKQRIFLLEQS